MPTAGMIFASGPAQVTCDRTGRVTSVVHEADGGLSYLTGATIGTLLVDGTLLPPPTPEVLADVDEVEFVYLYPDRLRLVVRHTFAAGWGIRMAFSSLAPTVQTVERAELNLEPHPGCVAWALTLGVAGNYSLAPASGTAPLLGGLVRRGSVDRATEHGLELTPFELRPESRYVVQLQWNWYPDPRSFARERYPDAPSALFVTTGQPVVIGVDDDVAVLAPPGVEADQAEDHLEVVSEVSGTFPFELRSARGTARFDLQWVDPVEEVLGRLVPQALSRSRTAAGVTKLAGVADALLVQHALSRNAVDDPDDAAEALDLFTARVSGTDPSTPLQAVYLCREYDRLGDGDLLAEARRGLLTESAPRPGLGIAATQLCLGLIVSGQPVEEVLRRLLRLVATFAAGSDDSGHLDVSVATAAAELELLAVTHAGPGVAGSLANPVEVAPRIAALGLHLGAGLPGRAVSPLPVADLSHLVTVFQLLPDGLSAQLERRWGCSAHELARRATPELLARLERQPIGDAHAWLVLALQTS